MSTPGIDPGARSEVIQRPVPATGFDVDVPPVPPNVSARIDWLLLARSNSAVVPAPLVSPHEAAVLKRLMEYPEVIEGAARDLAPHSVAFFLKELAGEFHSYYNAERFLVEDAALTRARLALALAVRQILRNGLALLGVTAPEKM